MLWGASPCAGRGASCCDRSVVLCRGGGLRLQGGVVLCAAPKVPASNGPLARIPVQDYEEEEEEEWEREVEREAEKKEAEEPSEVGRQPAGQRGRRPRLWLPEGAGLLGWDQLSAGAAGSSSSIAARRAPRTEPCNAATSLATDRRCRCHLAQGGSGEFDEDGEPLPGQVAAESSTGAAAEQQPEAQAEQKASGATAKAERSRWVM